MIIYSLKNLIYNFTEVPFIPFLEVIHPTIRLTTHLLRLTSLDQTCLCSYSHLAFLLMSFSLNSPLPTELSIYAHPCEHQLPLTPEKEPHSISLRHEFAEVKPKLCLYHLQAHKINYLCSPLLHLLSLLPTLKYIYLSQNVYILVSWL